MTSSFDDSSISRCESASSNPALSALATWGSLWWVPAEGNALSATRPESASVPDQKDRCLNKKANKVWLQTYWVTKTAEVLTWVRHFSYVVSYPFSRSVLVDTEHLCMLHFFFGTGKCALWAPSCMTWFSSLRRQKTNATKREEPLVSAKLNSEPIVSVQGMHN